MLNLELPPEVEANLKNEGAAYGMNAGQWAGVVLAQRYAAQDTSQSTVEVADEHRAAHRDRVRAIHGKYAVEGGGTVDQFLADRREEAAREMRKEND